MTKASYTSYLPQASAQLNAALARGLNAAADQLNLEMRKNLNGIEGGGVIGQRSKRKGRDGSWKRNSPGKGRNIYAAAPAGAFPGKRSGLLASSIASRYANPQQLIAAAGTNRAYGKYLEYGTKAMKARPWALRSFTQGKSRIMEALRRKVSEALGGGT